MTTETTARHADHYNRNLSCPVCGKKSRFKIWDRVFADKNPGLAKEVRDLSLFRFHCPHCGKDTYLDYDFLYIQSTARLVIYYAPGGGDVTDMHKSLIETKEYEFLKNFRFRLVRTHQQLLEKLAVFDAGLDDRIIEIMKVMLRSWLAAQTDAIHADLIEFTVNGSQAAFHFADTARQKAGMLPFNDSMRQTYHTLGKDVASALPSEGALSITPEWAVAFVRQHQNLFA